MFKNKIARHSTTFLMIILASIFLFPAQSSLNPFLIWGLLAIIVMANMFNLVITG